MNTTKIKKSKACKDIIIFSKFLNYGIVEWYTPEDFFDGKREKNNSKSNLRSSHFKDTYFYLSHQRAFFIVKLRKSLTFFNQKEQNAIKKE